MYGKKTMAGSSPNTYEIVYQAFFEHLKNKSDYFIPFLERRMSCEKWLQGEFIYILYQMRKDNIVSEFVPEKLYPEPRSGRCDLWFRFQNTEIWLELETIVTNYGSPGKPITNQIAHVIQDVERLKTKPKSGIHHVMFFVYPLAIDGSNDLRWAKHMERMTEYIEIPREPIQIPIDIHDAFRIYLSRPK